MGSVANTTQQHIEKLKSRGMVLDFSDEKITEILQDIGYYRLGFYWHPFEQDDEHNFIEGTTLSNTIDLYYLDCDLRNILTKYLNRIEINFRTKIVYYVSNKYINSPTWFIDPKVVNQRFIDTIERYYNPEFKRNHSPIRRHHEKYINDKYAPAWKTLEFFTFGTILKLYTSLKDEDLQKQIAMEYGVRNVQKFCGLLDSVKFVRNMCSHGGVIFDMKIPKGIPTTPMIIFNNGDRHTLDSAMKVIEYLLGTISPTRKTEMTQAIDKIFNSKRNKPIIKELIEKQIGYTYKNQW